MRIFYRWLVWFCMSLMLWAAVLESTHNHPNKTESATCSICVLAHSTTPTARCIQARPVFATVDLLQEEEVIAKAQLTVSDLGIRGPPAV
ncbi:MAG: hypothetical protein WA555_12225 [Candidatus Sulfotelmatobacter sp.]